MRYTGPRNKLARREGLDLGLKTPGSKAHERLLKRLNVLPGQRSTRRRRKISDHARQLREKQKLRFIFQISEKQLKNYFKKAVIKKGNTAYYMAKFLEKRLDNIVFRGGLAPTRASARQLVTHRHISVNKKIVSIPSYQVKRDDIITFSNDSAVKIPYIQRLLDVKDIIFPKWLERKASICRITAEPGGEDIDKQINLRLVIEHYSR